MARTHKPSYAENLLCHAGFAFQPRAGRMDLGRLSDVDVSAIIRDVDTAKLSALLEHITFCEIDELDLHGHSGETFIKLFRIAQLIIEYLVDAQGRLAANLNGLAETRAAKERATEKLNKTLAARDAEVATFGDEIHALKPGTDSNPAGENEVVNRIDPSLYPSQERRPTASAPGPLGDASSGPSTSASPDDSSTIRLHIVFSTRALHLEMNADPSLTVSNLKNEIASRLLVAENPNNADIDIGRYGLYHRDNEMKGQHRKINDYGVADDAALVLMPRPAEKNTEDTPDAESTGKASRAVGPGRTANIESRLDGPAAILEALGTSGVESRLAKLASIASKAHEELFRATRTLQFQASVQELNREAFAREIERKLERLDGALREEVRSQVTDAIIEHGRRQPDESEESDAQEHACDACDTMSPLSRLNIGELVETDGDCEGSKKEGIAEDRQDLVSNNEILSKCEYIKDPRRDAARHGGGRRRHLRRRRERRRRRLGSTGENQGKVDVSLKIDTTAEVFDRVVGPFNPPSDLAVTQSDLTDSPSQEKEGNDAAEEESETPVSSSILHYSESSSHSANFTHSTTNATFDANEYGANQDRTPTPDGRCLDRRVPPEANQDHTPTPDSGCSDRTVPPENPSPAIPPPRSRTGAVAASSETKRREVEGARHFRFSDDSVRGIAELVDFDANECGAVTSVSDTALKICPGGPSTTESDLQIIDVSHWGFLPSLVHALEAEEGPNGGTPGAKKKGRSSLGGKRMSFKKMMPKWNKSKGATDKGGFPGV